VSFELTKKQIEQRNLAASPARHILAFGGSRSGKTFGFARCVAIRALMSPNSRHLIARLHNIDVRQSVLMDTWPTMMRLCFPNVQGTVNRSDQTYTFPHGAEVWFGGLDDKERVEKILGKEYATIYVNESSQVSFDTINVLRTRLAQKVKKSTGGFLPLKAYYDLNPVGRRHWSYLEFVAGVRPETGEKNKNFKGDFLQMNPIDNPNLPPEYLEELENLPERARQRFLEGNYLSEVPNTLWPIERLASTRVEAAPELRRIVVAVDPSGSNGVGGDIQGIIVAAKGIDGKAYVLEDLSCRLSPSGWAKRVVDAYHRWGADAIVAEVNYGGAMVEALIRSADPLVKYKPVRASRGKHVRAEPVAALYEGTADSGPKAHHVGTFPDLEDQLSSFTTEGYQGAGSPDRADALVWAMTELMLGDTPSAGMLVKKRYRAA
jgi:phage terminase large subunit-like protein